MSCIYFRTITSRFIFTWASCWKMDAPSNTKASKGKHGNRQDADTPSNNEAVARWMRHPSVPLLGLFLLLRSASYSVWVSAAVIFGIAFQRGRLLVSHCLSLVEGDSVWTTSLSRTSPMSEHPSKPSTFSWNQGPLLFVKACWNLQTVSDVGQGKARQGRIHKKTFWLRSA